MRVGSIAAALAAAVLVAAPAWAAGERVLYVGDSLGVGTTPGLARLLGSAASVRGDSKVSRPSPVGLSILRQLYAPADDIVVFDLGTNDDPARPAQLASDLAAARQASGASCLVVATLNRPPLNGYSVDGLNRAVEQFANAAPNVQLVGWHAEAQADPALLGPDHVHPTPRGYALRAQLFAQAVSDCATHSAPAPGPRTRPHRARPVTPKPKPKPRPQVKVPGIESSGISFSEPLRVNGRAVQLLLPNTKPPYPAVVTVGAPDADAQKLAASGVATLEMDAGAAPADVRSAAALLRSRREVDRNAVTAWADGSGAAAVANAVRGGGADPARDLRAVVLIEPATLPAIELRDWRIRRRLGVPAHPVTTWLRVRARSDASLRRDPVTAWRHASQPVLAMWITGAAMPNRSSAQALAAALRADPEHTFGTAATSGAAADAAVRWLKRELARAAAPSRSTPLPPPDATPAPEAIVNASALYAPPFQVAWFVLPLLALAGSILRARRPDAEAGGAPARAHAAVLAAGLACAASIAAGVAMALHSDGRGPGAIAGLPWPFALAFVFAAALAGATAILARRGAFAAAAAGAAWIALALFWLL